jgi:hypothetical protein
MAPLKANGLNTWTIALLDDIYWPIEYDEGNMA